MKVVGDLFTPIDHAIIRAAVRQLPGLLGAVVEMRFWQHMELVEIADDLGLSIRTIEFAMIQAMRRLREICLKHPAFSRSKYDALKMIESHSVA